MVLELIALAVFLIIIFWIIYSSLHSRLENLSLELHRVAMREKAKIDMLEDNLSNFLPRRNFEEITSDIQNALRGLKEDLNSLKGIESKLTADLRTEQNLNKKLAREVASLEKQLSKIRERMKKFALKPRKIKRKKKKAKRKKRRK